MFNPPDDKQTLLLLRQRAEAVLEYAPAATSNLSEEDVQRLLHELQLQQVELEMQNEELRRYQIELQVARDQYERLYTWAPVGYLTLDNQATIWEANLAAATLLGPPGGDLPGVSLSRFIARDDQDTFYLHHRQAIATDALQTCHLQMQRPDGTRWVAQVESRSVSALEGQECQCFTMLSDITVRKQAENALEASRDELQLRVMERTSALATAYEELKQFTHMVSHDLRAPLINLRGFARELQMACDTLQVALPSVISHVAEAQCATVRHALEAAIPESLGFIHTAVTRMDGLIEAVSTLSREGRRVLHIEPVDMDALVHHLLQSLDYQLRYRQVRVTVDPLPQVQADRTAMHQVMGNLLSNALSYLEPGRPGELCVLAETGSEVTTFHIRDNGRGIAEADIPKIFEIFCRLGTQDVPGEGIGLAYVRMLVRRHRGDIWCESTPGVGTTFTFTIANSLPEGTLPVAYQRLSCPFV